ncbi:PLDc N-terminal domain-containing protein [Hahella sp. CR1]|uniref:PLDc N-terminal domain-containing protein n=1 Tax=Hahella sp. CR1 TaxID=2992807 RepID=UPI002442E7DA|nr:tetratricopeptide repeat protein [Hahella sp. CR1]MDG9666338.1 PLDc N-terminal domain-containing protein [Hahella sp. CR1]
MPIFAISIIFQVALVMHIVKTGRSTTWIWIVVMLPFAGSVAYFLVEMLPELAGSRTGRNAQRKMQSIVNPDKAVKQAAFNYSVTDSVETSMRLAEEWLEKGMFGEAKAMYEKSLKGIHQTDPHIMYGLAKAEFGLNNYGAVRSVMDDLIRHNPDFKNAEAHLLYARALMELNETAAAKHEFEALEAYFPGPEASYWFGMFLKAQGRERESQEQFKKILEKAKVSGRHYHSYHKKWLKLAKQEFTG